MVISFCTSQMDHQELHVPFSGDHIRILDPFQKYAAGSISKKSNLESSQPTTNQKTLLNHNESDIHDIVLEDITTPKIPIVPDFVHESQDTLYSGATLSVIQGVSLLLSWFSAFRKMSKASFSHLQIILRHFLLPPGNKL